MAIIANDLTKEISEVKRNLCSLNCLDLDFISLRPHSQCSHEIRL